MSAVRDWHDEASRTITGAWEQVAGGVGSFDGIEKLTASFDGLNFLRAPSGKISILIFRDFLFSPIVIRVRNVQLHQILAILQMGDRRMKLQQQA